MYSAVVVQDILQRGWKPRRWASWSAIGSWQWQLRAIIKADLLTTTWEVAEELSVDHSVVIQHMKQIGKVKKCDKWIPQELTRNKKCRFEVLSSLTLHSSSEPLLDQIVTYGDKWIVNDSWWRPASLVVGLSRRSKALPEAKLAPKKGHGHCLVVCCPSEPLELSESQRSHYVWEVCPASWWQLQCLQPAWANREASSPPQQHPTTLGTPSASEAERAGLWTFASSTMFTWPLANQPPPDTHLDSCLQGKCFHNQQGAENAFQEFVESWSTDFYAIVINLFLVGKNVLIIMVLILINKAVFELSYDDLKFMLQTLNYVCTNLMYSIFFPMYPIQIYSLFLEYATCFYTFPPVCSAENSFLQV